MSIYSASQYSPKDWAVLFSLCAEVSSLGDKESPFYIEPATAVYDWLSQYSIDHDLPEPTSEDVHSVIGEALSFLNKFAENHHDDLVNQQAVQDEQNRRDEKNGLYSGRWDVSN